MPSSSFVRSTIFLDGVEVAVLLRFFVVVSVVGAGEAVGEVRMVSTAIFLPSGV